MGNRICDQWCSCPYCNPTGAVEFRAIPPELRGADGLPEPVVHEDEDLNFDDYDADNLPNTNGPAYETADQTDRTLLQLPRRVEPGMISQDLESSAPSQVSDPARIQHNAIRLRIIMTIMHRFNDPSAIANHQNGMWIDIASLLSQEPFAVAISITDDELNSVMDEMERVVGVVVDRERDEVFVRREWVSLERLGRLYEDEG